ncbi:MAG: phytanoyl-CoA dioxygenase family protein [Planctomycetota bacterium]|jgi:ectoine hydroxylase-related dioxygenase (phytanoyl-CoA dioxygenase family)
MNTVDHLMHFGYAIEPAVVPADRCREAVTALREMEADLRERDRTAFIGDDGVTMCMIHLSRPEAFLDLLCLPPVMEVARAILRETVILHDITGSRTGPGGGRRLHIDSRLPVRDPEHTMQMQALLCLDEFTETNGATVVCPGSHRSGLDPRHLREESIPLVPCAAPRGSVVYFMAQTWHDSGPNLDRSDRWSINLFYARWWLKPNYDFTQCGPEIFARLSDEQKTLFGFTSRPPASRAERQYIQVDVKDVPRDYATAMQVAGGEAF